jgi:hypothetical protein
MIIRRVRANLNREAEKAALDVFSENLRNLLLTPPCKGTTILGIDPGKLTRFWGSLFLANFLALYILLTFNVVCRTFLVLAVPQNQKIVLPKWITSLKREIFLTPDSNSHTPG